MTGGAGGSPPAPWQRRRAPGVGPAGGEGAAGGRQPLPPGPSVGSGTAPPAAGGGGVYRRQSHLREAAACGSAAGPAPGAAATPFLRGRAGSLQGRFRGTRRRRPLSPPGPPRGGSPAPPRRAGGAARDGGAGAAARLGCGPLR